MIMHPGYGVLADINRALGFRLSRETGTWKGVVGVAEHLGSDMFLHVHVDGVGTMTVRADGDFAGTHGDTVFLTPDENRIHRFDDKGLAIRRREVRAGACLSRGRRIPIPGIGDACIANRHRYRDARKVGLRNLRKIAVEDDDVG